MTLCEFPREISLSGMHRLHQTRPDKMTVLCFVLEGKSTESDVDRKLMGKEQHITVSEFYDHIMKVNRVQNNTGPHRLSQYGRKHNNIFLVLYRKGKVGTGLE